MKKNDLNLLRKTKKEEQLKKLASLKLELAKDKLLLKRGELKNLRKPKNVRRSIAQISTILTENKSRGAE